ncbi:GntR family transcriptional regulator [Arthrobacter sp. NPDC080031]|uniref:GntR family transcriptional regulator n=1 Tax=Arthrobacter sp. NPDC080031 TaxID=3155918 RepID=UPI00344E69B8
MATSVYESIRSDIMSGHFQPGDALAENALAGRYGISRTPIREALQRLEHEQLVVRTPRGVHVKSSTPEEILDIYDVRITLEGAASRAAAERRSELDLMRIRAAHDAMKNLSSTAGGDRAEANRVFHEAIWAASHSPTLVDLLNRLNVHLIRYPSTTLTFGGRWEEAVLEHERLVDAVAARDAESAASIAEKHMRGARDVRLQMYALQR